MAIQHRRGAYTNFDPSKLLPGEYAVVQSGDPDGNGGYAVYMCFGSGIVKRLVAAEDLTNALAEFEVAWEDVSDKPIIDTTLSVAGAIPDSSIVGARLAQKQNTLTFDTTPRAGSTNPVTSSGIKQAIDAHTVAVDATLTQQGTAADAKATGDAITNVLGSLAEKWQPNLQYLTGDIRFYNNKLYIAKVTSMWGESTFQPANWREIKLSEELQYFFIFAFAEPYRDNETYQVGDYCLYGMILYRCIATTTGTGTFDYTKWETVNILDEIETKSSVTVDANGVMHF